MLRYTDSCKPLPLAAVLSFSLCCAAGGAVRRELLDASDGLLSQTVTTRGSTTGSSGGGSTVSPDEALVIGDVSTVPDSRNSSTGSSSGSVSMGSTGNAGGTGGSIIVSGGGSSISGGSTASSSTGSGTTGISSTGSGTTESGTTESGTTESGTGSTGESNSGGEKIVTVDFNAPIRYRASSVLSSQTNTRAKFNVDVNITSTQQRALFTFTVKAVSKTRAPVFSNSSYHTNTGQLVATFACVPKPTTTLGTYRCTTSSLANITVPFRPVNRPKALVDAGFFSNPTAFYSTIKVNGIRLRGSITASVANL
ncbi:unnamed protein product [Closterium sp. NIES-64]|nr:unnamed protein product [Closterium sp. NIES-64]